MTFKESLKKTLVTNIVIVICLIMYLVVNFYPNLSSTEAVILFGAYYKPLVIIGEFWRLLTSGFIHIMTMHLFMNMFSLSNLGRFMELQLGSKKYLVILLFSIIGGSIFQYIIIGNSVAVGLSGGLYGLLAAYSYLLIKKGAFKIPEIRSNLLRMYLINLMINFVPGVAYSAHLGGFIIGLFIMAVMDKESDIALRRHFSIAFIIILFFISYLFAHNSYIKENEIYLKTDYIVLKEVQRIGLKNYSLKVAEKLDKLYKTDNALYYLLERGN